MLCLFNVQIQNQIWIYTSDEQLLIWSARCRDDFVEYADTCFHEFGDEVKYWTTINEPWYFAVGGYVNGEIAPGFRTAKDYAARRRERAERSRKTFHDDGSSICPYFKYQPLSSSSSSSSSEKTLRHPPRLAPQDDWPYIVVHHQLFAHAKAVKLYREKYQVLIAGFHYIIN